MNFYFDGNLYSSIFSKNAIKNPTLASKWLATWRDMHGEIHHDILHQAETNNQAEYGAMLQILRHIRSNIETIFYDNKWLREAIIYGDSQLIIYQMTGKYKVKEADLKPLWAEGVNLVHILKEEYDTTVKFRWIKREVNNMALGIGAGKIKTSYPGLEESHAETTTEQTSS